MQTSLWVLLWWICVLVGQSYGGDDKSITIEPTETLGEIVVTATKTPHSLKDVPVDTLVITSDDIKASGAKNLVDVLDLVPGVVTDVHDDIFGAYTWRATMQGLSFNDGYALVLVDGKRMVGAGQSGGMGEYGIGLNQIPLSMIERIEIVQGPGSALYGSDAVAGVVNIITKRPSETLSAGASGSYGWYEVLSKRKNGQMIRPSDHGDWRNTEDVNVFFSQTPFENLSYYVGYNYERAEDTRQDPIGSYRHTVLSKFHITPSDDWTFQLEGLANHYEKSGYRDEDTWRLDFDSHFTPTEAQKFTLRSYIYRWDFEHGFPGYPYGYKHGHQEHRQLELQYDLGLAESHLLTLGGEYREQLLDYKIENRSNIIPVTKGIYTSSAYLQDEFSLFERLILMPGVRLDHHSEFGDEVNPKLSLMAQISSDTTFRASVGRAFKSPTIRQLYYKAPYEHGSFFIASNPDLDPEISWGYSMSIQKSALGGRLGLWLSIFRNDIKDLVARVDTGEEFMDKPLLTYENVKKARTQGVQLQLKAPIYRWFEMSLAYTYTDSEDRSTDKDLPYVPRHHLVTTATYRLEDLGLELGARLAFTGRQYTNTSNTQDISDHAVVDFHLKKDLLKDRLRMGVVAQNVFGSRKGDEKDFRTGRTYLIKIESTY